MKKSIYYWSPCLGPIGTVKSTLNSAIATSTYGKTKYQVYNQQNERDIDRMNF